MAQLVTSEHTPESLREEIVHTLGQLCTLCNIATTKGLRVDFSLGPNSEGQMVVKHFEMWQKLTTN